MRLWAGAMTGNLRTAVEELSALTVGEDPLRIEALSAGEARAARRAVTVLSGRSRIAALLNAPDPIREESLWSINPARTGRVQ